MLPMNEDSLKRLINKEWEDLEPLIVLQQSRVPLEMVPEMAETLCEFFKVHDLLVDFIQWCIQKEVENTRDYTCLFREDSFVIMLMNRLAFGDAGVKYLKEVIQGLVKSVTNIGRPLDVSKMRVSEEECQKNVRAIFKIVDDFLPGFAKSVVKCPVSLRQTLACLQTAVDAKFGKKDTPFVIEFMFFHYICPAIINPKKYDLTAEDLPSHATVGLVNISKLLNDLALNNTDKWQDSETPDFVKKRHPLLLQHLFFLTEEKGIQAAVESSRREPAPQEEKDRAAARWRQFLMSLAHYYRRGSMTAINEEYTKIVPTSADMFDIKLQAFKDRLAEPDWKPTDKDCKSLLSVYTRKDKDHPSIVMVKADCIIEMPVWAAKKMILQSQFDQKADSLVSSHEVLYIRENYSENHITNKLPFPLSNRDFTFCQWEYGTEQDDQVYIVQDHLPAKIQRKKGLIRGQMFVSGYSLQKHRDRSTHVVALYQLDMKGSLPQWLINHLCSTRITKLSALKDTVERLERKKPRRRTGLGLVTSLKFDNTDKV